MESSNKTFSEVIVVEGYHDLAKIKEVYPEVDVYITNGSEISDHTLNELKQLNQTRGLILLLDPDYQGERIRRIINEYVGPTKHAFLNKSDCINKKKNKVGIEHANKDKIISALTTFYSTNNSKSNRVKIEDLYKLNLMGTKDSKALRLMLGEELGIGSNNGKTLLKKINMFGIPLEQIKEILRK